MDDTSDSTADGFEAVERPLIDAAWAQFEALAARHTSSSTDGRRAFAVPGYRILQEIHRGGQGVVYQAMQESTRRKVAIKILKEGPFAEQSELARFDREVDVLSRLKHPHIVAIHDRGLAAGHAYFVMDYIPGRPLDAYVTGASLCIREVLDLCRKVCEAVNVAHLRGVIHRDLKPTNIRIDEEGEPHVLDFGLAKFVRDTSSSADAMTMTGQFVGSLPWASPEQAEGRSDQLDIRTDVYSLGVILYHLLAGCFPYPASGRMDDVVRNIIHTSPARPSTLVDDLDRDVEVILLKCLEKDPERRYQSAGELARDIQRYLNGEPIEARPANSFYQLRQFARRNKALVASAIAIIIILAAATTVSVAFAVREAAARGRERLALDREVEQREQADQQRRRAEAINQFVTKALQSADPYQGGNQAMLVADAMLRAVEQIETGAFQDDPQTEAELLRTISAILNRNARSADALPLAERALATFRRVFPGDHPEVARSLSNQASVLRTLGRNKEAEPLLRESLAIEQRLYDGDHADVAAVMMDLATTLRQLGHPAEAEPLSRDALAMRQRLFHADHQDVAASLNNLALILQALGRTQESEPLSREALEMRQRLFPGDHPDVAQGLNNLAFVLQVLDRNAEAEPIYRDALAMRRRLFKGDHPDIARTLNNLASLLQTLGRNLEAEELYREALAMRQRLFGDQHPDVAQGMSNLAFPLQALDRYSEAESLLRESLAIRLQLYDGDHPDTAVSMANLADLLDHLGQSLEVSPHARDALEMSRRLSPGDHPDVARRLDSLAHILLSLGQLEEAETLAHERLEMTQRLFDGDHGETVRSLRLMARMLQSRGGTAESESFYRDALAMHRRLFAADHPDEAIYLVELASALAELQRPAEAEPLYREAIAIWERILSTDHPNTADSRTGLGRVLVQSVASDPSLPADIRQARLDEAEVLLSTAQHDLAGHGSAPAMFKTRAIESLIELYDIRQSDTPNKGYDTKAAEWRARLQEASSGS